MAKACQANSTIQDKKEEHAGQGFDEANIIAGKHELILIKPRK